MAIKKKTPLENAIEAAVLKKKEFKKVTQYESMMKYHETRSGMFSTIKDKENATKQKHDAECAVLMAKIHLIKLHAAHRDDLISII